MINTDYFRGKKITVVGLARSGLASANLLYDLGAKVSVTDNQDNQAIHLNASRLKSKEIRNELARHTEGFIKGSDLLVISPGVPSDSLAVIWAQEFKIPIISEIEMASLVCPATIIAVTGSNGKTTVTTLIGKILEAAGKRAFVCGNIGQPFSQEVAKMAKGDFVSLEVSSFQLERINKFKPKIAVILNFTGNHLDRYNNMDEYLEAKKRIFMRQDKADYLLLNSQDEVLRKLTSEARAEVVYFSKTLELNSNQSCVLSVSFLLGIGRELVLKVFRDFPGVQHRQEFVGELGDIKFINDSKSTTVESAIYALESVNSPVILIAGGRDKGLDYSLILDAGRKKIKEVVLIGEARQKIREALHGQLPVSEAGTLEEAVNTAFNKARPGYTVLLSPMCSSFDMFRDYEERGDAFKKAVHNLKYGS